MIGIHSPTTFEFKSFGLPLHLLHVFFQSLFASHRSRCLAMARSLSIVEAMQHPLIQRLVSCSGSILGIKLLIFVFTSHNLIDWRCLSYLSARFNGVSTMYEARECPRGPLLISETFSGISTPFPCGSNLTRWQTRDK